MQEYLIDIPDCRLQVKRDQGEQDVGGNEKHNGVRHLGMI